MPGGPAPSGPGIGASAPKSNVVGIAMVGFAAFGGILFGYDTGTIAGITAMEDWLMTFGQRNDDSPGWHLSTSNQSLVVSILSAGTFFGEHSIPLCVPWWFITPSPSQAPSAELQRLTLLDDGRVS